MHAGYHFTKDKAMRMAAGRARLQDIVTYAEKKGALILLENLNKEPDTAEVHYLAHTIGDWQYYWDIKSPNFKLSFTANPAHLVPEGVEGFVKALNFKRVHEVRLADCWRNGFEEHLVPGKGNMNFGKMFKLIEGAGFKGHYTNAFGTLEDMQWARGHMVSKARAAGVAVDCTAPAGTLLSKPQNNNSGASIHFYFTLFAQRPAGRRCLWLDPTAAS